jgi:hypothetical protein
MEVLRGEHYSSRDCEYSSLENLKDFFEPNSLFQVHTHIFECRVIWTPFAGLETVYY